MSDLKKYRIEHYPSVFLNDESISVDITDDISHACAVIKKMIEASKEGHMITVRVR